MKSFDELFEEQQWRKAARLVVENSGEINSHALRVDLCELLNATGGYEDAGWTFEYDFDYLPRFDHDIAEPGIKVHEYGRHVATIHNRGYEFALFRQSDGGLVATATGIEKATAIVARFAVGDYSLK